MLRDMLPSRMVKNVNDLTNFVAKWIEFYFHDIKILKKLGQKKLRGILEFSYIITKSNKIIVAI